jgi:hypothetical protein
MEPQISWVDYYWSLRTPKVIRLKPDPVPYYRAKPRPLSARRVNGRGMTVRRTKPWNMRNH